jgi:hypothetical protein
MANFLEFYLMYLNVSVCQDAFRQGWMRITPLVSTEPLILRLPRTGPNKPLYHNLHNKAMGLLAIITR